MKNAKHYIAVIGKAFFLLLCILSFADLYLRFFPSQNIFLNHTDKVRNELFDPAYARLNSMEKMETRADSEYYTDTPAGKFGDNKYPEIVSLLVRKKFYHGYLRYSIGDNFLASLAGRLTRRSYDAIIKGDEILKYAEADCRQQSLVMMELLLKKDYPVRGIHLKSNEYTREHFAFEAFYNNDWHFFDPDMEPNSQLLFQNNRPSIEKLREDNALLTSVYWKDDPAMITSLFKHIKYNEANALIPLHLSIFHSVTKLLSNWGWLICLAIYFIFMKQNSPVAIKIRRNKLAPVDNEILQTA